MRSLVLLLCLLAAGCSVGITVTNAPSTLPDCMGKTAGGGCR
jgi:hypothetical protein